MNDDAIVLTGAQIQAARFLARKSALKLEIAGLRRSSGRTAYSICKSEYGLRGSRESVLAQMDRIWALHTSQRANNEDQP